MGSGSGNSDLIAKVGVKFSSSDIKVGIDEINRAFKQLALESNKSLREATMNLGIKDFSAFIQQLQAIAKEEKDLTETEKALQKANEELSRALAAGQAEHLRDMGAAAAAAGKGYQQLTADTRNFNDEIKRFDANRVKEQLGVFKNLQSGNIKGLAQQITSGGLANMIGGNKDLGIGAGNPLGILTAGGQGMVESLGLTGTTAAMFATTAGAIMLVASAVSSLTEALLKAYGAGQQYLARTSLIRKEIGVLAQDASTVQSLLGFTQNANSPFATIIFNQVAANLQNVADMEKGLLKANPQVMLMAEGLKAVGINARDANGETKDVVDFAIELSKSLEKLDPSKYAQTMQRIGGLFGKDFAAIVGTNSKLLEQVRDSAVKVTNEQLRLADVRTAAIMIANNAETQFNVNLATHLTVADIMLQKLKEDAFKLLTTMLQIGDIDKNAPPPKKPDILPPGTGAATANYMLQLRYRAELDVYNATHGLRSEDDKSSGTSWKTREAAAIDYKATLQEIEKLAQEGIDAETEAAKNYTQALKNMNDEWDKAKGFQDGVIDMNDRAVKSWDAVLDSVMRAAKSYDSYYDSYRNLKEKIDKLDKLSGTTVGVQGFKDASGKFQPFGGKTGDVSKYLEAVRTEQARDADETALLNAKLADWNAKGRKGKEPGQETNVAKLKESIREGKINDMGAALGLEPGQVFTQENIATSYRKRGLSPQEIENRQNAIRDMEQLQLGEKENQFNILRTGMQGYIESLREAQKEGGVTTENQAAISAAFGEMATSLGNFATKAGLFDSSGFVRAMAETGLQMKLTSGEFGSGADAVRRYYDAQSDLFGLMDKYADVISRERAATTQEGIDIGAIGKNDISGVSTGDISGIKKQQALTEKFTKGQVTGGEFAKLLLESQRIDTESVIKQAFDLSYGKMKGQIDATVTAMQDSIKKVVENPYNINLDISEKSLAAIKLKLEALGFETQQPGFKTPLGQGISGKHPIGEGGAILEMFRRGLPGVPPPEEDTSNWGLEEFKQFYGGLRQKVTQDPNSIIPENFYGGNKPDWSNFLPTGGMNPTGGVAGQSVSEAISAALAKQLKVVQDNLKADPLEQGVELDTEGSKKIIALQMPGVWGYANEWVQTHPLTFKVQVIGIPIGGTEPPPPPIDQPRAIGGSVQRGKMYKVGESGEEMFVPGANGYIIDALTTGKYAKQYEPRNVTSTVNYNYYQNQNSNTINVDARGAAMPATTAQAVTRAAAFITDNPRITGRR